jgi:hypothetical protein
MAKQLIFNSWVEERGGAEALAKELDITSHAVRRWLRGECPPRPMKIKRLIMMSKNVLTFDVIIKETTRNAS